MSVEVGKRYYIMQHAYHHFLGEVTEILGKNSLVLKNVRRIYSCQRGWTEFFRDGCGDDTIYTIFPDGYEIHNYMSAAPWKNSIPK